MTARQDALDEIARISQQNGLTLEDITACLSRPAVAKATRDAGLLSRILGYIGGILVFSGIGVFLSMFWDDMNAFTHIAVTLGTGFIVFLMAVSASYNERYERAATPLYLAAAFLQPMGIFVMLAEFATGKDPRYGVLFMAFIMLLQQALVFIRTRRSVLGFTSIFFGATLFLALFDILGWDGDFSAAIIGTSLLCLCHAAGKSTHRAITPFWYLVGSIALLAGTFSMLQNSPLEIFYLGLCAFMIFFSTVAKSRMVLFSGTLSMLCYIGYFTAEHFVNSLGWPVALIVIGMVLIGLSSLALRINSRYIAGK